MRLVNVKDAKARRALLLLFTIPALPIHLLSALAIALQEALAEFIEAFAKVWEGSE